MGNRMMYITTILVYHIYVFCKYICNKAVFQQSFFIRILFHYMDWKIETTMYVSNEELNAERGHSYPLMQTPWRATI